METFSKKEIFQFIFSQPDEKEIDWGQSFEGAKKVCGCLMLQFAKHKFKHLNLNSIAVGFTRIFLLHGEDMSKFHMEFNYDSMSQLGSFPPNYGELKNLILTNNEYAFIVTELQAEGVI